MKTILILLCQIYRAVFSPMLHFLAGGLGGCRFEPTCSRYFEQAVRERGVLTGSWLGICRICRCHPWGKHGYDPVPPAAPRSRTEFRLHHHRR